jgi:hypothetical protein
VRAVPHTCRTQVRSRFAREEAGGEEESEEADEDAETRQPGPAARGRPGKRGHRGPGGEADAPGSEDFRPFLACLKRLGLKLLCEDAKNRMFVVWLLRKDGPAAKPGARLAWPPLKACLYKRR